MFLPTLLALATGVYSLPPSHNFGRVVVQVRHPGPTVPVKMSIRTKQVPQDEWTYFRDVNTYPRVPRSSPLGRKVTVTLPPKAQLQRYVQVCSLYEPPRINSGEPVAYLALESCANVKFRRD
jgi:hypothetical protein